MKNLERIVIKIISIIFSIFFSIVLLNTLFFNRTIAFNYSIPVMIIVTALAYLMLLIIYYEYKKKNCSFLEKSPKWIFGLFIFLVIFLLQFLLAKFSYTSCGWDCSLVINNALALINGDDLFSIYFSRYPNNIGILLLMKYLFAFFKIFIHNLTASRAFFIATIFNIVVVDISAVFTFLCAKKILGKKQAYLSLIFILPLMIFSPNILIPYTDTITMVFPIMILYLYIKQKEKSCKDVKKYLLIFLNSIITAFGITLKPTVAIMPIAIILVEILNINNIKFTRQDFIKKSKYILIIIAIFVIGFGGYFSGYSKIKEKNLGKIISKEEYENNSVSFVHFLMMGMQERPNDFKTEGKNQTLYGAYNENDVSGTVAITGSKAKKEHNIKIIKERLKDFGVLGYSKFLYNKANWILSDGTFFYGQEGYWNSEIFYNKSNIAKKVQKFVDPTTKIYKNITANIMQISWILVTIGLIFSNNRKENKKNIDICKITIIGIILFILLFEGRSRYLINHIPIFILVGTYGLTNSLRKIILTFKHK